MARKSLQKLITGINHVELEEIDVVTNLKRSSADGIRMIPAIKINDQILSGILLSPEKIKDFLNKNIQQIEKK